MPAMFISTAPGKKRKEISIRLITRQISVKKIMSTMTVSTSNKKIAFLFLGNQKVIFFYNKILTDRLQLILNYQSNSFRIN